MKNLNLYFTRKWSIKVWGALLFTLFLLLLLAVLFSFKTAPTIPNVPLVTIEGEKITTGQFKGKVSLINFWATSCSTCVHEMPKMVETYQKFSARGYTMLAIAMSYDPPNYVINYAQTRALPFTVAFDTQGLAAQAFGKVQLTPTSILVDKQGHIIKQYVGEPDFAQLHALIEQALSAPT